MRLLRNQCAGLLLMIFSAQAVALTDLALAPINFLLATPVKPNLLFILDDSGSMQGSFLGDEVLDFEYQNAVGYRSHLCNKIYYNPQVSYPVPVRADGSAYPQQNFYSASYDGFRTGAITVDLSTAFMAWRSASSTPPTPASTADVSYRPDCQTSTGACSVTKEGLPNLPGPAYYFVYHGDKPERLGDGSADDHCRDIVYDNASAGRANWTRVLVGPNSGLAGSDETQNFANWFSYHRTRMLTMKTAVGRAFSQLDDRFRVGYSALSEPGVAANSTRFLRISDFSGSHRASFYEKLYAALPTGATPLRGALSKAGRLYAGKLLTGSDDPVQYSCQQNTTILSTDGYWGSQGEAGSYGPKQIDGVTNVGSPDSTLARPMFDGAANARPARMATLTVEPRHTVAEPWYSVLISVKVDGVELMSSFANVIHQRNADPLADAIELAYWISTRIKLRGYRAFAEGNRVSIIAPATAGAVSSLPVITSEGSFTYTLTPFADMTGTGRASNTLADVAAWYFENDLRTPALGNCGARGTLCDNNVPIAPGQRGGSQQHMVTHTIGLGANGTLRYREDYDTATSGDFRDIVTGALDWPDPIYAPGAERVDDLWHAAVNGGGRYFSARSPEALARALSATMSAIRAATGAASASASSSQEPAEGDNLLFSSRYRSLYWDGELEARRIVLADGSLSDRIDWSAAALLKQRVQAGTDDRKILMPSDQHADGLKDFLWTALDADERALFAGCGATEARRLSQCKQFSDVEKALARDANLLSYLRGQFRHEQGSESLQPLFRKREQVLGAPINAQPLYVGAPAFRYADGSYGEFRDRIAAGRAGTVYLAANDGMLHAFDALSGRERWAFIPRGVLPELWRVADIAFATGFRYLLDGTPVAGDICPAAPDATCAASDWRTILVGGLGAGGREYYALDITEPERPKLLWRLSADVEPQLGYALGKPVITKRRDGTWVVLIASGYNNVNPGDGHGVLFVLNAATGSVLHRIDTGAGSTAAPAGLAQLNAWVDNLLDNTAEYLVGGDLLGNLWRFDISDPLPAAAVAAMPLARFVREGVAQPVTTRPELSMVRVGTQTISLVSVGTGRYLGPSDVQDKSVQSVYTMKLPVTASGLGDVRSLSSVVRKRLIVDGRADARRISDESVDWLTQDGWYVDLDAVDQSGERVSIDPEQQLGMLSVVANVPDQQACRPGAQSWMYAFNYLNGNYLPVAGESRPVGRRISTSTLTAGARLVRVGQRIVSVVTDDGGNVSAVSQPADTGAAPAVRRVAWRELDQQ